jgi:antitoxin component of MazEF toxin-antitoxin module
MPTRKLKDKNIRNLTRVGRGSISVTIPVEMVKELKWKERQKVVLSLKGKKITIEDWPKK